jgi:hypothetical protein
MGGADTVSHIPTLTLDHQYLGETVSMWMSQNLFVAWTESGRVAANRLPP